MVGIVADWDDVRTIALGLPDTDEQRSHGHAAWRVHGKLFVLERPLRARDLQELGDEAPTGAILGAVLVNAGKTYLTGALPELWLFALGALFILVSLFLPRGILGLVPIRQRGDPPLPKAPDLLRLTLDLSGVGGLELPLEISATDSFGSVTEAAVRRLTAMIWSWRRASRLAITRP